VEILANLGHGFIQASAPGALLYCLLGASLGMFIGVLPGLGPLMVMSLLLPFTFSLDITHSLIMLAGIYYGAQYGGSITSILLNLPGTASSAVICLDGHPMAQQGRAGVALFLTTFASLFGSFFALAFLILFAQSLASIALSFTPADYFSMMLLGLVASAVLAEKSLKKGILATCLGIILGLVGSDVGTGVERFTYGFNVLWNGIEIAGVAMAFFGLSEMLRSLGQGERSDASLFRFTWRSMFPSRKDLRAFPGAVTRGAAIGSLFGVLPGTGTSISAFVAYLTEKRISRHPETFGNGAIEGISAPEAANNATAQSAFIPTLALGVPGDAVMALLMGAMMIQGIQPGPLFMTQNPELFWTIVASFIIGNLMLIVLNLPLIGIWVRLLMVPQRYLLPMIFLLIGIGAYTAQSDPRTILIVTILGLAAYVLRRLGFPMPPVLLGFVLGPLMEEHMRRALLLSRGDFGVFLDRPISAAFLTASLLLLLFTFWQPWRTLRRRRKRNAA